MMRSLFVGACALLSVGALAQLGSGGLNTNGFQSPYPAIRYTTVAQGVNSRIGNAEAVALQSYEAWAAYFSKMAGDTRPGQTPVPRLADFNTHDLIVIHTGSKPTAGFGVYVTMIRQERAMKVTVDFVDTRPPQGVMLAQMLANPYVVVAVEKQKVEYEYRRTVGVTQVIQGGGGGGCSCGCPHCSGGRVNGFGQGGGNVVQGQAGQTVRSGTSTITFGKGGGGQQASLELFPPLPQNRDIRQTSGPLTQSGGNRGELFPPLGNGRG